jgi:hypothetical protein
MKGGLMWKFSGWKGRAFEFDVMGVHVFWDENTPYLEFDDAIELAIFKQPIHWHPLYPTTALGRKLLNSVKTALYCDMAGQFPPWIVESVIRNTGLYVALGTPADFFHGIDAVICCDSESLKLIVTIDLKLKDNVEGDLRDNHVIVTKRHFSEIASNGKLRLDNIAGVIAEQLIRQLGTSICVSGGVPFKEEEVEVA